jgi:hypothetical protein
MTRIFEKLGLRTTPTGHGRVLAALADPSGTQA